MSKHPRVLAVLAVLAVVALLVAVAAVAGHARRARAARRTAAGRQGGSMLEDDDQRGAAHFVEHLAFKGSTHVARQELVAYLRSIGVRYGADLNAETGFERTVYLLPIPTDKPDNLAQGFQVRAAARRFLTRDHYVEMVMLPGTR